jgi:hypothetical protein
MKNNNRFSRKNGMRTNLSKPMTIGSYLYIERNFNKMTMKNMANVLHRPVSQVRKAARQLGLN